MSQLVNAYSFDCSIRILTQTFSDSFRAWRVTCHMSRVKAGSRWGMKGVTAVIGSDLDGRQILHDTPSTLRNEPNWSSHWSMVEVEASDWSIALISVLYRLKNGKSLNFEVSCLHLQPGRKGHVSLVARSCTHRIVPTERRKSFEINLKVGSRLEGVLFESFLLVVSCRYRGLTSQAGGASMGPSPCVARELEARKFWKDQYVHFCCE